MSNPLLFFPQPKVIKPTPNKPHAMGSASFHIPSSSEQVERLDARFTELDRVFKNQAIQVSSNPDGIAPEAVLVIETRGPEIDFLKAVRGIPSMDWLGEVDLEELDPDSDFYDEKNQEKKLNGKLLFSFTNQTAKDELLRLWELFKKDKPFPKGKGQWKDIISRCEDIRLWGIKDRLEEYKMQEWWKSELENTPKDQWIPFEIELWHRGRNNTTQTLQKVQQNITSQGGKNFGTPVCIDEIRFLALKVEFPASIVSQWLQSLNTNDSAIPPTLSIQDIRYFRPIGCSVQANPGKDLCEIDGSKMKSKEPYVAVLDGLPLEHHKILENHLQIDDPDDFASTYSSAQEQIHGTSICSLVLYGDLNAQTPLTHPVYCRPILQPDPKAQSFEIHAEIIPQEVFAEDLVHRAVRRMFEKEGDLPPAAPSVKIINLSVADSTKPFDRQISSWGRLLDWLSYKYRVLFLVAAGNQKAIDVPNILPKDLALLPESDRVEKTLKALAMDTRNRKIFSPADGINVLSVGAAHSDSSQWSPTQGHPIDILPDNHLMSPASSHGPGFKQGIKPEILFPGGRQLFQDCFDFYCYSNQSSAPGIKSAVPGTSGELDRSAFSRGTSQATALASNAAGRIMELLMGLQQNSSYSYIHWDKDNLVPLIKAMLVHGANPKDAQKILQKALKNSLPARKEKEFTSRFIGYGLVNVDRVLSCTQQRATLLGWGSIPRKKKNTETIHEFSMPLPACMNNKKDLRRLTVTLAWLTPINCGHKAYRKAKLEIKLPNRGECGVNSGANDHNQINRGTISHNVFEGNAATLFVQGNVLRIQVQCTTPTGELDEEIPYGIVVSFEVGETVNLPIYEEIRTGIEIQVRERTKIKT